MKRCSTLWSLLFTAFALAWLTAGLGAQNENMPATITMNESIGGLRASPEAGETPYCKGVISERKPIPATGTLQASGQALIKPWGMPRIPDKPDANRKTWIGAGSGSLPLAVALQADITQKYGTNPGVLQVYFGHRR
jgi:hypothetical protein